MGRSVDTMAEQVMDLLEDQAEHRVGDLVSVRDSCRFEGGVDGQPQEPRHRGGGGRLPHLHSPLRGQQGEKITRNN